MTYIRRFPGLHMINLIIAIVAGVLVTLGAHLGFSWVGSILPGMLGMSAAYVLLARRTGSQVQAIAKQASALLDTPMRSEKERDAILDKAIRIFETALPLSQWQFLIGSEIEANIGALYFMKRDYPAATPHLAKASQRSWQAKAYLGCIHYLGKEEGPMKAAFEEAVSGGKKDPMSWAAYAWCLENSKKHDEAIAVAGRAVAENPSDEKLKKLQNQLQNGKRLKMNQFEPGWWQYGLEKPPMETMQPRMRFTGRRR